VTGLSGPLRVLVVAMAALAGVVAGTWLIEWVVPPPYSALLAAIAVGLIGTTLIKRQPGHRALHLFAAYLRARARGADEREARDRLLRRARRPGEDQAALARAVSAAWMGRAEKERVVRGVAVLLAREGKPLDDTTLGGAFDRVRDRLVIPGWDALPAEFVASLRERLAPDEFAQMDELAQRYRLFQQRFFRQPSALGADPATGVEDFARLLASLGTRMRKDAPRDAERAYALSLRLRPAENLAAHAGLALLLDQAGRSAEAAREATAALAVLDELARRAGERPPTPEDISPFATPKGLREALERVARSPGG
jgi:hypothetical protein